MAATLEQRAIKKLSWRLPPLIVVIYFVAYVERTNIGFATLTMNKDLGLSAYVFGWGAGIFFLGYFLFEVPSNVVLEKTGARVWIARSMITWGIVSGAMVFVAGPTSFLTLRFLLTGAAAADGIALVNSIGNLEGYVGPFIVGWIKDSMGSFEPGFLAHGALLSGIIAYFAVQPRPASGLAVRAS